MTFLDVRNLAIDIAGREVVSDVSFTLDRGQCLGIVGETGSGKTLTCRAVTGTLARLGGTVTRGSVCFDGTELTDATDSTWRRLRGSRVALVPQASLNGLNPVRRVGSQLIETVRHHRGRRGSREHAIELLRNVQLADPEAVLTAYPHQLSGGMRQRVMIALSLAGSPELLVADEPTTALDVTVQKGILDLLASLCRESGMSLMLITHDLGVVEEVCDRVAVVYAGASVETGATSDVLGDPRHPYTRALIAARPATAGTERLWGIPGAPPSANAWPSGCRFEPRCPLAEEKCAHGMPVLELVGPGHAAACHVNTEV